MEVMTTLLKINLKKERVILSDVLPYETPITFSNKRLYEFIVKNKVEIINEKLSWKHGNEAVDKIIQIIFGVSDSSIRKNSHRKVNTVEESKINYITIPFDYGITHKEDSYRYLSVIHPRNQVKIIEFYERYKELIQYFCNRSSFSLRHPYRVAKTKLFNEKRKTSSVLITNENVDNTDQEKLHLRSYFGYQKIRSIHEFFESYDYHRCEQKYNFMAQLDISKCFNSIYTHSLAWAIFGKDITKAKLAESKIAELGRTFAHQFDVLMQKVNYNETNGILIGPELSRIFAELILQDVDVKLEKSLSNMESPLVMGSDYMIYRYVDDYFIFFNESEKLKEISHALSRCLSEYKFNINEEKTAIYEKPLITEITISKKKISDLINDKIKADLDEISSEKEVENEKDKKYSYSSYIHKKSLITAFKAILKETKTEYKDVVNYTFSIVESKTKDILKKYIKAEYSSKSYSSLIYTTISIIDFCFFIYSVSPRANSSIKLSRVLKLLIDFAKTDKVKLDERHIIFKRIYDNVDFIVKKYETTAYTQVETLYLINIIAELGRDYWLSEKTLVSYFGGKYKSEKTIVFSDDMNYFSITSLLFYMKDKVRYSRARLAIKKTIRKKFESSSQNRSKDSELIHLLLDCISCPYLSEHFRKSLLKIYGVSGSRLQNEMMNITPSWFTKWRDFHFSKELDAKQSDEVY